MEKSFEPEDIMKSGVSRESILSLFRPSHHQGYALCTCRQPAKGSKHDHTQGSTRAVFTLITILGKKIINYKLRNSVLELYGFNSL